ncbi:triacylglycerol lipase, partial [Ostertagia ostertagi]
MEIHRADYSDKFARTKMLPLAAAAYSHWPQECLENRFANATLIRQLNVTCGPFANNDVCSGFTAVVHGNKAIVISFRGTDTYLQLVAEADLSVFHEKMKWSSGGYVSKYFYDGFMDLWNAGMRDDFIALRAKYPRYNVWVTGHSLGAALASLAASFIIANDRVPSGRVKLVTFGQPRVGDHRYAWVHDEQMAYSFRVTHWRDVVPHIPPENFLDYYHHASEAPNESDECSDGLLDTTSIQDHRHYFNVDVSAYGINGCNTTMDPTNAQ